MANQFTVYEQIGQQRITCKECEEEQSITHAAPTSPGQIGLQEIECVNCGSPLELLLPGKILSGPFTGPPNK